ncbi:helix-turn-helix domain-containing protein [Gloeothece verrucosa]|uniref:Transcriptional regulator, XRE family n=1 Tax=Gloeothece verrucosa (strain PCC 7822) TaxID=497965 RepID=E0UM79_GLOV7|nr:helix-turn-helix transcriptional regulator [Gloeothece verrucosa]ADN18059.1 transcriptional regulator, XRE family [Gloeothece verrucosa PCC 7822]
MSEQKPIVSSIQIKFGRAIQQRRKELNLTQENLAHRTGLDRTYIANIETGKINISLRNIEKLAKGLSISLSDLFKNCALDGEPSQD